MKSRIIRLDKRHLKELARVDVESEHPTEEHCTLAYHEKLLRKRFKQGNEELFGFKEGSIIKGYISFKPFFPGWGPNCEAYWLAVRKQFQGQGVGSVLLRFVEARAKKKGFKKIYLYTNEIMKRARKFYEANGYSFVNKFPGYYKHAGINHKAAALYGKSL